MSGGDAAVSAARVVVASKQLTMNAKALNTRDILRKHREPSSAEKRFRPTDVMLITRNRVRNSVLTEK